MKIAFDVSASKISLGILAIIGAYYTIKACVYLVIAILVIHACAKGGC